MSEMDPLIEPERPVAETVPPPAPAPPAAEVAPPPRKKGRAGVFFFGALSGCLVVVIGLFIFGAIIAAMREDSGELSLSTNKIAVLPIEGEILDSRETLETLHRYADNNTVKGIVVRINSPGGAIAPSQEIYSEIRRVREKSGKPIVASMDSVAASGGYYIAVGCDRIVANPGSITGSIGVILQWMEMKDLVQWAKMKPETITSGELKAAGSPYRELSDAERAYFQRIVTQLHVQFVKAVAQGRSGKLTEAEVTRVADGRVFTGEEAHALKLVDELGSLDHAIRLTAKLAGIKGEPATIYPKRRDVTLLELLTDTGDAKSVLERLASRRVPQFLYRW